jgi:hypothetical protein
LAKCAAIKPDGERCKGVAIRSSEWCPAHHPEHKERRRRAASKGGRSGGRGRPQTELQEVKALLAELTTRVLREEGAEPLETGPAAVANQLINTRLRAIEVERKIREQELVLPRLEALADVLKMRSTG